MPFTFIVLIKFFTVMIIRHHQKKYPGFRMFEIHKKLVNKGTNESLLVKRLLKTWVSLS